MRIRCRNSKPKRALDPPDAYDRERIRAWDWSGVDVSMESQTIAKRADSLQFRVIQTLLALEHDPHDDIVFDDGSNAVAVIVALKVTGDRRSVHFRHGKHSSAVHPGTHVDDLHVVCGHAQRSVYRKGRINKLLEHLR